MNAGRVENKVALKTKTGIIVALTLALLFVGLAAFTHIRQLGEKKKAVVDETEVVPVRVAEAMFMDLQRVLDLTGELKPAAVVDVYPKIPGRIIEDILVETGDRISEGALIAILEDSTIKAQLEEATAALAAAEAGVRQSEVNLEVLEMDVSRMEELYKAKAISKQQLDHTNAQYKAAIEAKKLADAQVERARAVLNQLQIAYNDHKIYAPMSGFVAARYAERGSLASASQPIIRISQEDELKIICSVTEKDFPAVKKGMKAEITVDALPGRVFEGVVSLISPTIDPATRTAEIEIHIPNEKCELRSGMFARIKLFLGEREALVVPTESVSKMPETGSYYVYVVESNKAVLKNVKIGITQGNFTEITDGLTKKELVVTRGQNRLFDGAQVSIEEREVTGSEAS